MKVGDLVRYMGDGDTEKSPGIILRVYDYEHQHLQDEGSKWRKMASVHWFHIGRPEPMEHALGLLELVSGNR